MMRAILLGLGSYVPERIVTNDELRFLNDQHERCDEQQIETSDEWIQKRTGIRERRFAEIGVRTSDIAVHAAQAALADAACDAKDVDCIIFATLSSDIQFPGSGVFLQDKLGIAGESCACYDIREQCSGFVYGLQMADAFVRSGLYKKILLVGADLHSHNLDFTTRGRDVTVLFGDGAGAVVIGACETEDERAGIMYTDCHADGRGAWTLHMKVFDIGHSPAVTYDPKNRDENHQLYTHMEGKRVYLHAVRNMVMSTQKALADTNSSWDDIDWFVPHQANLRINQKVVEVAEIPEEKVLNSIELYGNTTAATIPLTIDHWRTEGRVKKGDRVLATVFGSGFTWGSAIFQV